MWSTFHELCLGLSFSSRQISYYCLTVKQSDSAPRVPFHFWGGNIKVCMYSFMNITESVSTSAYSSPISSFPSTSSKPYKWQVTLDTSLRSLVALQSAAGLRSSPSLYCLSVKRYVVSKKPPPSDSSNPLCCVNEPQYHTVSSGNWSERLTCLEWAQNSLGVAHTRLHTFTKHRVHVLVFSSACEQSLHLGDNARS